MINVTVFVDSGRHYREIDLSGHAGYAAGGVEGQEIVCAAVSALVLNMANSVEHFTEDRFEADMAEESGDFNFRFTDESVSPEAALLMDSLVFGLLDIEEAYGEPYIKIRFKEV